MTRMSSLLLATPYLSTHLDAGLLLSRALWDLGYQVTLWDHRRDSRAPAGDYDGLLGMKLPALAQAALVRPRRTLSYWPDDFQRDPGVLERLQREFDVVATPVMPTPRDVHWVPFGWDPMIHQPCATPRYAVGCAGTWTPYKERMLAQVWLDLIVGNGWEQSNRHRVWAREAVYLDAYAQALSSCLISVNVHHGPGIGVNRRLFESIACTFTLTDRAPGVAEVLGEALADQVAYRDPDDLARKVAHFTGHPEERERCWTAERAAIAAYTYRHAAKRLVALLEYA